MKRILALACCLCSVPTWAADVGLGVSAKSDDSTIYVPIDFGEQFRLEPFINFSKNKTESPGYSYRSESLLIGTGLFGVKPLGDSISLYYGGRLSYLEVDSDTSYAGILQTGKGDGFRVAPTFGFEYAFNKHLSLGGEAGWFYQDVDWDNGDDETRNGTETRLILRLRF